MKTLDDIWAKSPGVNSEHGESLFVHTTKVVQTAKTLCNSLPFEKEQREQLLKAVTLCAALHDAGKFATGFQLSLRGKKWGRRHEILSFTIAANVAPDLTEEGLFAIATHHKPIDYWKDWDKNFQLPYSEERIWKEMVSELFDNKELLVQFLCLLRDKLGLSLIPDNFDQATNQFGIEETWFIKDEQFQRIQHERRYKASLLRGLLITCDHIASSGIKSIPDVPTLRDYDFLIHRKELGEYQLLTFQDKAANCKGSTILKAPTGSGKTAAVLLWASANQSINGRLFYVLPHTASINAMHQRLSEIYCQNRVGVLHHRNAAYLFHLLENDDQIEKEHKAKLLAGLAREMYYPIRVCTPHQLLRVALQGKGWETGLSEFKNGIFIFDEIHAYEPLLTGLIISMCRWLQCDMKAKVLFASATLPLLLETKLIRELNISMPNLVSPDVSDNLDQKVLKKQRHKINIHPGSLIDNIEKVISEIKESKETTLIICNHVATSQEVYKTITNDFKLEATLLHARFNSEDRFRIEGEILGNAPPNILVATQAVEVSLNLDYQRGYSEPAPIDALAQRFGRVNRTGSRPPASIMVFEQPSLMTANGKRMFKPYDEDVTKKTIKLLPSEDVLSEETLTSIINEVYGEEYLGESKDDYDRGLNNSIINNFQQKVIAGSHRDWVEEIIEEQQEEVLPFSLLERYDEYLNTRRYLEAQQLLVPIRCGQKWKMLKDNTMFWDEEHQLWKTNLMYSSTKGLSLNSLETNLL